MAGQAATEFDKRVGQRLVKLRNERKLTQRAVAGSCGVSAAQLQKYEKGTNCLSVASAQKIARFMGVSPLAFFDPVGLETEDASALAVRGALDHARRIVQLLEDEI